MDTAKVSLTITEVVYKSSGDNEWNSSIRERVSGLTRKAYGWSKYGGKNLGLVQDPKSKLWSCQACGETQGSDLPSYLFEICINEFIRICTSCQSLKLINHIQELQQLISLVRSHREFWEPA